MVTKNPFPGMNPFFEQRLRGTHTMLITYICESLQEQLPPDLVAAPEEEVVMIGKGGQETNYRPDVKVHEPWSLQEPTAVAGPPLAQMTEPIRVLLDEDLER